MAGLLYDFSPFASDEEDVGGGLLAAPRKRTGPDMGMLGLAAGLLEPTPRGQMGMAFANGLKGWAGGVAAQRKLDEADAENDPNALMQKYMTQAAIKAKANQLYGKKQGPLVKDLGDRFAVFDPETMEELHSIPKAATPTAVLSQGITMGPNGQAMPVPGWGNAAGQNKFAQNAPLENLKTGNDIFKHEQSNQSDLNRESSMVPIKGNQNYSEETAKNAAKRLNEIIQEGEAAQNDMANYQKLSTILSDYEGGKLANARKTLAEYGNSVGLKGLDPNLDEKQLFDAIVGDATLNRLKMMGGNDSNQDREFAKQIGPSLTQTAEGRKKIIDFYMNRAKQKALRAQLAQQWTNSYGRLENQNQNGQSFDQRWLDYVNKNPAIGGGE